MERKAGSDHENILSHQFAQRLAERKMPGRVQPANQRELKRMFSTTQNKSGVTMSL